MLVQLNEPESTVVLSSLFTRFQLSIKVSLFKPQ